MRWRWICIGIFCSGIFSVGAVYAINSVGPTVEELTSEIDSIKTEIEAAKIELEPYDLKAAIALQIQMRIATLETTASMLSQKRSSWLRGIDLSYVLDRKPIPPPAPDTVARIRAEIEEARIAAAAARAKADSYTGGLLRAISLMEEATYRSTIALQQQRLAALNIGFAFPDVGQGKEMPAAAPIPSSNPGAPISQPTGPKWNIAEHKSPVDDSLQLTGSISSTDDKSSLIIRCKDTEFELYVTTNSYLGNASSFKVIYRLNDDKALQNDWTGSTGGKGVFYPRASLSFAQSLPDGGKLFLRIEKFDKTFIDATFMLGDVSATVQQVSTACARPNTSISSAARPAAPNVTGPGHISAAPNRNSGSYFAAVTSQRTETDARQSWRAAKAKYPLMLNNFEPMIKRVNRGKEGVYYRATLGPFTKSDADSFCIKLTNSGGECIVVQD